jgi:ABC-type multidrug transport system fused ATPase/permease subunit
MMMTLYRLVEPTGGTLHIDGEDVLTMGLRDLRSRLALVPQDPVIFSGTVRSNLDPFDEYPDEALWNALSKVQPPPSFFLYAKSLFHIYLLSSHSFSVHRSQW